MVEAEKPKFYKIQRPFREVDQARGRMRCASLRPATTTPLSLSHAAAQRNKLSAFASSMLGSYCKQASYVGTGCPLVGGVHGKAGETTTQCHMMGLCWYEAEV